MSNITATISAAKTLTEDWHVKSVNLSHNLNLSGYLLKSFGNFSQTAGGMSFNGGRLCIIRDYVLSGNGSMAMGNLVDYMFVGGDYKTSSTVGGGLVNGVLEIEGNFTQTGNVTNFNASGNHTTIFSGSKPSEIYFSKPETNGFAKVIFQTNSAVFLSRIRGFTLTSDLVVLPGSTDDFGISYGTLDLAGFSLTGIPGNFTQSSSSTTTINLRKGRLNIAGDFIQSNGSLVLNGGQCDVSRNCQINGGITFGGGHLNIGENYTQTNGDINLGGGQLKIEGNFTLTGGSMTLINAADYIRVGGNFETSSNGGSNLGNGIIEIRGNFKQKGNTGDYNAGSNHTTIFSGSNPPEIFFNKPDSNGFAKVNFQTNSVVFLSKIRGFTLTSDLVVLPSSTDDLGVSYGTLDLSGFSLSVPGNFTVSSALNVNSGKLDVHGNYIQTNASLNLSRGQLNISGNYEQTNGSIVLNGGRLNVDKNLTVSGNATTTINNADDYIFVGGNCEFNQNSIATVNNGILEIKGNFTQEYYGYAATANHTTLFSGDQPPEIYFGNPSRGYFANVRFSTKSAIFLTKIYGFKLTSDLTVLPGSTEDFGIVSGTLDLAGYHLSIPGNFILTAGLSLNGGHCVVSGNFQSNSNITFSGGHIDIGKNYTQTGGNIELNNGKLNIGGNYTLFGGTIIMNKALSVNFQLDYKTLIYQGFEQSHTA